MLVWVLKEPPAAKTKKTLIPKSNMIKSKLSLLALVTLATVALTTGAKAAPYTAGDLILGFRVTGGVGASSNVLVNIGSSLTFRDLNGSNSLNITSIGTDLDATFGLTAGNSVAWYNRTDISFGVVGVFSSEPNPGGTVNSGDPSRTLYATRSRSSVGTVGSANSTAPSLSGTNRGTASNSFVALQNFFTGATASGNNANAAVTGTSGNSWTTFTVGTSDFGVFNPGVEQTLTASSFGSGTFGPVSNVEGALDLYRILDTTTSASPSGTVGTGSYETTIVIDQSGNISAVSAVPEPSTYALLGLGAAVVLYAVRRRQANA